MKTSVIKEEPKFSPVVVTITLESERELKMLRKLAGKNKTVARAVASNDTCSALDEDLLSGMLGTMYAAM